MPEQIKQQQGQGMVEYLVIMILIGLGSITAFNFLGQTVRTQSAQLSVQVSGEDAQAARVEVVGAGGNGKHCCGVRVNPPVPMEGRIDRS